MFDRQIPMETILEAVDALPTQTTHPSTPCCTDNIYVIRTLQRKT
jgi:hypothetical protein